MEKAKFYEAVLDDIPRKFEGRNFLLVEDVSTYLEVAPRTIHGLIARGELPAFKIGKEYRIPLAGFKEYVAKSAS